MGSKRAMLTNGLGLVLAQEVVGRKRFVDLFCGSASVAWHVAQRYGVETIAHDLQQYSAVLAEAVLSRSAIADAISIWTVWLASASAKLSPRLGTSYAKLSKKKVAELRNVCSLHPDGSLIRAYGGHYYSASQIAWIQAFRDSLPTIPAQRSLCLASLIIAASKAAASPGHTAQPFQPTPTALQYLEQSWSLDIPKIIRASLFELAAMHSKKIGTASVGDAIETVKTLKNNDLVFVDPPYSGVQYSRYYHVLESIATGSAGPVSGVGRYPSIAIRPSSKFSQVAQASKAMDELLAALSKKNATVVLTFPDHACSNGLSGEDIRQLSAKYFKINEQSVKSVFSTLGGVAAGVVGSRSARQKTNELILCLRPF